MGDYDLGTARGKIELDASSLGRTSAALHSLGGAMMGTGALMVGAFGYAVYAAAEFERKLDSFKAVTNATDDEIRQLQETILDLSSTTVYTADQVAEATIALGKAGLSVEEVLNGAAEASIALSAAAEGMTVDESAEIMANAMRTFNLEANESMRVANALAGAANESTLEVQDLAVSFRYVGPVAATAGVEIEELATALAVLGDRGIKGSTAGTSLRGILLSLSPTSKKAKKELEALGIITEDGSNKFFDAAGNMKSLAEVSQILQDATRGLTEEQKINAFNTIFQRRAMASAIILADQGEAGFNRYAAAIGEIGAADVAATKLDNLSGDMLILKSNVEAFVIEAGGPFQETARGFVQGLTDMVTWFRNLNPEVQETIMKILLYGGLLLIATGSMFMFLGSIVMAYKILVDFKTAMVALNGTVKVLTGLDMAATITKAAHAMKAFGLSMLTNPIFLVVAAIMILVGALVYLYFHSEGFRKWVDELWQDIQRGWDVVLNKIREGVDAFKRGFDQIKQWVGTAKDTIVGHFNTIKDAITGVVNFVRNLPRTLAERVKSALIRAGLALVTFFEELPGKVIDGLFRAQAAINNFMAELPRRVGYAIGYLLGFLVRMIAVMPRKAQILGSRILRGIIDWLGKLPGMAKDKFFELNGKLIEMLGPLWDSAFALGRSIFTGIWDFVKSIPGRILETIQEAWRVIQFYAPIVWDAAVQFGKNILNGIWDFVKSIPGRIWDAITGAVNWVKTFGPIAWDAAVEFGKNILNGIWDFIKGLPDLVWDLIDDVIQAFKDMVSSAFNAAKGFAGGIWDGFKSGLGINSPSYLHYAIWDIVDTVGTGVDDLKGYVDTMHSLSNPFNKAGSGFSALSAAPASLGLTRNVGMGQGGPGSNGAPLTGGDVFNITEANQKTPEEIAREIVRKKGVRLRA